MNLDASKEEKEKADRDYIHSLPPAIASVIRKAHN
jgi:hypothetical protein